MKKEDLITLRAEAEKVVTQLYSQGEDLKNRLKQNDIELERYRGEYRAYQKMITELESKEPDTNKEKK